MAELLIKEELTIHRFDTISLKYIAPPLLVAELSLKEQFCIVKLDMASPIYKTAPLSELELMNNKFLNVILFALLAI